ncbi:hypothetical protein NDU88_003429 [Pleurodeles waltl]|uniref:Uncharacterized protein n=1 Tax=Pleurodeles waltl TaxID=8319 RepID=A0AAV7TNJ8_PLEWA|nr:hypothetical protein NDU88_003429 [Pleurodeles waltl]
MGSEEAGLGAGPVERKKTSTSPRGLPEGCGGVRCLIRGQLRTALMLLNPGKAPRPNGFPPEYWRLLLQQAGQPLLEMFQEVLEKGKLLLDLRMADTVVLLKPGTAGQYCEDL